MQLYNKQSDLDNEKHAPSLNPRKQPCICYWKRTFRHYKYQQFEQFEKLIRSVNLFGRLTLTYGRSEIGFKASYRLISTLDSEVYEIDKRNSKLLHVKSDMQLKINTYPTRRHARNHSCGNNKIKHTLTETGRKPCPYIIMNGDFSNSTRRTSSLQHPKNN